MYKILTLPKNETNLESVLLNNETDYLSYVKDKNYVDEPGFKQIMFGKPECYPAILVTHFSISMCRFIDHRIFGQYIYPHFFNTSN